MSHISPALVGVGLIRSFGVGAQRTTAVREVSLAVQPGEVALIMGPSGSGKSTLLALLSGLLEPDRGRVMALGQDLWSLLPAARKAFRLCHCGFIFQGCNLFPALTARQQLELVLRWGQGVRAAEARRRSELLLKSLGLTDKLDLRPQQLSGGEQQRVAIGRALVKEPTLCFADEPTAALDWAHGQQIIELLHSSARERGTTVIIVTHDHRLLPYADRVFHLEDGVIDESRKGAASHDTALVD